MIVFFSTAGTTLVVLFVARLSTTFMSSELQHLGIELYLTTVKLATAISACLIFLEMIAFVWWRLMRLFGCGSQYFGFPVFELFVAILLATVGKPLKRPEDVKIYDEESEINDRLNIDKSNTGSATEYAQHHRCNK